MIAIDQVLISDDLIRKEFVCDLVRCKGGCCEEGDAGAPLLESELDVLEDLFEKIKPYLTPESVAEIVKKGKYVYNREFGWVTPTLGNDREICVYGVRDSKGIIRCVFEQAYRDGVIKWKKPISCHLFPVIYNKGKAENFDRLNYEPREKLCNPACVLGKKQQVPVYEFLKEPITRLYGKEFYDALDKIAEEFFSEEKQESGKK